MLAEPVPARRRKRAPIAIISGSASSFVVVLLMVLGGVSIPGGAAEFVRLPIGPHGSVAILPVVPAPLVPLRVAIASAGQPATWVNVTSGTSPLGRVLGSMGYDPLLNESILFGGSQGFRHPSGFNDTWAYRNGSWKALAVGAAPSPRVGASLVYNARDGELAMIGGEGVPFGVSFSKSPDCWQFCNGSWAFSGANWTRQSLPTPNPLENYTANQSEVYFQGTTAAYDSTDRYDLVVSSYLPENWSRANGTPGQTWSVVGSNWTNLSAGQGNNSNRSTPNLLTPVMADDGAAGGVLLFGGAYYSWDGTNLEHPSNATWFYSGGIWMNVSSDSSLTPPAVPYVTGYNTYQTMTYDAATQSVILVDGGATWAWKNFEWTNVTPPVSPPAASPMIVWDQDANATLLFGGTYSDNRADSSFYNATWEWTSEPPLTHLAIQSSRQTADSGVSVNFSATFLGGVPPLQYSWQFGDGGTSSSPNPSHAFTAAGRYNITLNLSDSAGHSLGASLILNVSTVPVLNPNISPSPTDAGITTHFFAGSSGGWDGGSCQCVWNFGDSHVGRYGGSGNNSSGNSSNLGGPGDTNYTYLVAGNYTPQVWWNDSGGIRLTKSLGLLVNPTLAAPAITASPADPYLGQLVNFTARASGGTHPYRYAWEFGDGGTGGNLQNISHVYTTNGPFLATVTITDAVGGGVRASENITTALNLSAFANVSFGAAPLPVGFGSHVSGGSPGYRFAWSFGDGGSSPLSAPQHVFSSQGVYRVTVLVTDQVGNSASNSWNVTVATGGGPITVGLAATSTAIPLGGSETITATVAGGQGAYALRWTDVPAGCHESALVQLNCTPTSTGQFGVSLVVTDSRGASGNATTSFVVGNQYLVVPRGPGQTTEVGFAPWIEVTAIIVAALVAIILGVIIGRRGRAGPPVQPRAPDPRYAAYRATVVDDGPTATAPAADPRDELF
jgi:PKD repeat protein